MNAEIKAKWVAALRSGEYRQTQRVLRNKETGGFCCLGVLCDLHSKETGGEWNEHGAYGSETTTLPDEVMKWAGLGTDNTRDTVKVSINGDLSHLADINDSGTKFPEIADLIEAQL